jgi:hypothetical protein
MLKKVFIFAFIALIMASCGNMTQESAEAEEPEATETEQVEEVVAGPMQVAVIDFPAEAEQLVGKEIMIEGTVIHVCKHGGKKMFLVAEDDPDIRVKITTDGEMVPAFQPELEGSYVKVHGVVEAIAADEGMEGEGVEHDEDADHENHYHKPQYSIKCAEYAVVVEKETEKESTEEI